MSESKLREENGDRDHETKEKARGQAEAGGAAPVVPLNSGTSSSNAPKHIPEPKVLGPGSRPKRTEKKAKTAYSDASNDQDLVSVIATLKSKLYQESIKSKHYTNAFNELNDRLVELENIVQPGKKTDFQKLQGWVHSKRHFH